MKNIIRKLKKEDGFTLMEMLIVLLIISVLLILMVTNFDGVNTTISETKKDGIIQTVESKMVLYEIEKKEKGTLTDLEREGFITSKQKTAYEEAKSSGN
ncbi:MAG: prepilin-type N-terminal cleavage/methylation domain-containing protein [Atopostipes sp.]|nr:prepilin-type N-terminal cleavage/methylation domain-containing protein [Atopostipes sp.]